MKKTLAILLLVVFIAAAFTGCGGGAGAGASEAPSESAAPTPTPEPTVDPGAVPEGVKGGKFVTVVCNVAAGGRTKRFLEGCVTEGAALGFTVSTISTGNNDERFQQTVKAVIDQGTDGLILVNGGYAYSYDLIKPALDKGIAVSLLDTPAYEGGSLDGAPLEGVAYTSQDTRAQAQQSLDALVEDAASEPVKIIKLVSNPNDPAMVAREEVYAEMEQAGKIQTLELVTAPTEAETELSLSEKVDAALAKYPEGTAGAAWASDTVMARAFLGAMYDADRSDIPLYSIGVSDEDLQLMAEGKAVWKATSGTDPKLAGIANMRIIALEFAGDENTPAEYTFEPQLIRSDVLTAGTEGDEDTPATEGSTMENLGGVVDGWGDLDSISDLNRPWMDVLRAENVQEVAEAQPEDTDAVITEAPSDTEGGGDPESSASPGAGGSAGNGGGTE